MLLRSITTFAAVAVACVVCLRSDADARGGGGFHGGAIGAGFHMGVGHFAFQHGRPFIRGDMHRHLHGSRMRHAELNQRGGRGGDRNRPRADFGHWHRSSGFGNGVRHASVADGQWHAGGEFR